MRSLSYIYASGISLFLSQISLVHSFSTVQHARSLSAQEFELVGGFWVGSHHACGSDVPGESGDLLDNDCGGGLGSASHDSLGRNGVRERKALVFDPATVAAGAAGF